MVHAVPFRYIVTSTVLSAPTVPTTPKLGHVDSVTTCVLSFVQVSFPSAVKPMNLVLSIAAKNILTGDSAQCDFGVLAVPVQVHSPCNVSEGGAPSGATAFSPQAARAITATMVWIRIVILRAGPERAPWHDLCVLDQHGCSCGTCYEARSTDVGRGRSPGADAVGLAAGTTHRAQTRLSRVLGV